MRNRGSLHGLRGEPRRHRHRRPIPGAYPPLLRRADRNSRTACSTTALNPRAMGTLRTRCPEGGDQAGVTPQRRPPRGLRPAASENPGLSDRIRRNTHQLRVSAESAIRTFAPGTSVAVRDDRWPRRCGHPPGRPACLLEYSRREKLTDQAHQAASRRGSASRAASKSGSRVTSAPSVRMLTG